MPWRDLDRWRVDEARDDGRQADTPEPPDSYTQVRLLLVEDDPDLADAAHGNLRRSGFAVDLVGTLADADASLAVNDYACVVLDLRLPDGNGVDLLIAQRKAGATLPVLILTASDAVEQRVEGLNAGADDYLVKPYAHAELVARVRALLRRPQGGAEVAVDLGRLTFHLGSGEASVGGEPLRLPRRERSLLEALMRRQGRVVARAFLEQTLWGQDELIESNSLESHVSRLRRRLAEVDAGVAIHTVRGVGYFVAAER